MGSPGRAVGRAHRPRARRSRPTVDAASSRWTTIGSGSPGARQHNLKNLTLALPKNQLVVITGVSGSGKSSLAFDTLYAEGQRRYVESLSAYARQFLERLEKPDVDFIDGLSPAIAIEQRTSSRPIRGRRSRPPPRSTTTSASSTPRCGQPHDPETGQPLFRQTIPQIAAELQALPEGTRVMVLAPLARLGSRRQRRPAPARHATAEGRIRALAGRRYRARTGIVGRGAGFGRRTHGAFSPARAAGRGNCHRPPGHSPGRRRPSDRFRAHRAALEPRRGVGAHRRLPRATPPRSGANNGSPRHSPIRPPASVSAS